MCEQGLPKIYLITPPVIDINVFPDQLASILDAHEIACVRLALATASEDTISRAADICRDIAHKRDVAIVLSDHTSLSEQLGLDGVHLEDSSKSVRNARKVLGPDAIVGSFCGNSRHDGLGAGDAGADYIAFGPVSAVAKDQFAKKELFEWWSEMIETPLIAEGGLTLDLVTQLSPFTDFFGFGEEIWTSDNHNDSIAKLINAMQ